MGSSKKTLTSRKILCANWKADATRVTEATIDQWASEMANFKSQGVSFEEKEVVICPPFPYLSYLKSCFEKHGLSFKVGAQDVSRFLQGSYTGEVTAPMLQGLVDYCIIGHSERRKYFGETNEHVIEKVKLLLDTGITPILCISDLAQLESYLSTEGRIREESESIVFVCEPPTAISGGKDFKPVSSENIAVEVEKMTELIGKEAAILYGGSINPDNAQSLSRVPHITGGLSGQASLDPLKFKVIIEKW
jgi:triosephosphate isomerase (TIM)